MMGRLTAQEELFYEFRLDDHVPPDHLLRRIDAVVDFGFVHARLAASYSHTGRPSVDPELMLRMLLVGYLYGVRSERRLCDDVHLNLAFRWFCKLGLNGRVPDHSSFSKNRYARFREEELFRVFFEEVVRACAAAGLAGGRESAVDASFIEADANWEKKLPGQAGPAAWGETDRVSRPVRDYLEALDAALPPEARETAPQKHISPVDPQAGWSTKSGRGRFGYSTNYYIDTETSLILDVEASPARFGAEVSTTPVMVRRTHERLGVRPERLAADAAYGSAPLLRWLLDEGLEPHIPVMERVGQTRGKLTRDAFTYDPPTDSFTCPEGHKLTYRGMDWSAGARTYFAKPSDCAACPSKPSCTDGPARRVIRLTHEDARDQVRALKDTPGYVRSRQLRKRIERLFGHLKRNMKLTRLKLRGLKGAAEEFLLAATAQNLQLLASRAAQPA
jgi:transposase